MSSQPLPSSRKEYRSLPRMNAYDPVPPASPAATDSVKELYNSINRVFPGIVTKFEAAWEALQEVWFSNRLSSNAADNCGAPEYYELMLLGPKIIPLVVYKLASSPDNFKGVFLYNELEQDKNYRVDPNDVLNYSVLQRQANLIVDMNRERNDLAHARIEAWKAHCTENSRQSQLLVFTECEEYAKLVELGEGIIAHLMLAYAENPGGFWYELLSEAGHGPGNKSGLISYVPQEVYDVWDGWFQNEDHSQMPRWHPYGQRLVTDEEYADDM